MTPSPALKKARNRLILVSGAFMLAFVALAVRAGEVSFLHPTPPKIHENVQTTTLLRGDIVDVNGAILATDVRGRSLYADPFLISDPHATARALHAIFPDLAEDMLERKLRSSSRFVWIRRHITQNHYAAILEIGEPGLAFRISAQRVYPQGALAAHIVGYTDTDGQGLAGVERAFNADLVQGKRVTLALDIRLQHAVEREVARAISDFSAKAGVGLVVDVNSGQVLAGVSLPDFNPNTAKMASADARFNRLSLGVYELGSLFKIFSMAAFVETMETPLSKTFDVRNPIHIGRFTIRDFHPENRILTAAEVFIHSSNIGAAMMGSQVGGERLRDFYAKLGLLQRPQWALGEVGRPLFPDTWREVNTMTAAYGHGIAASPLQTVMAVIALVGDGRLLCPQIVLSSSSVYSPVFQMQRQEENETWSTFLNLPQASSLTDNKNKDAIRVVSNNTIQTMRYLLRLVVMAGTGATADVEGYRVGGKTGTAEKPNAAGGYDEKLQISSFIGVFPAHAPRYVILVMVDEPHGTKESYGYATGGWVSAPAVARIVRSMAAILGLPKVEEVQHATPAV